MIPTPLFKEIAEPLRISMPYPPALNHYWILARGHIIVSGAGKAYRKTIAHTYMGRDLYTGPLTLCVDLYRPRKAGDIDGPLKILLDALQGVVYENDRQIVELHVRRYDDKGNPRAEVTITSGYLSATDR